jgi:hypothetical protein
VASANSPRVTEIRKSSRTFADLISRPTQRVAFVWNEPKRWLAAPATAIFASPASKQSRTCEASASGRQRRFDRTTATSGLPPATDIVSAGRQVCFVPKPDSCTAAKRGLIRSPHRRQRARIIRAALLCGAPQSTASSLIVRPGRSTPIL